MNRRTIYNAMKKGYRFSVIGYRKRGFTLIELIMAIVVLAIVMIPLGVISLEYMRGVVYSRELVVAEGLAKTEMAIINNLSYTDATLEDGDDDTTTNYQGYAYDLRRTVSFVPGWSNNLKQVNVRVYPTGTAVQVVELVTYIANVAFGHGSGGGGPGGGGEADSLVVSAGTMDGKKLKNITLENTDADTITITGVTISFAGAGGIKLKTITMNGIQRWSGTENSGSTVTLDTSFALAAGTTYPNTATFSFSKDLSSVSSLIFIMSDATETSVYSW